MTTGNLETQDSPHEESRTLPTWVAAACNGCGKCCLDEHYMGTLPATESDVRRWRREGRDDILEYVSHVFGTTYDLWVKNGIELTRCPFVRKNKGKETYRCTIYETRPEVCRRYPVTIRQMQYIGCEILKELETVGDMLQRAKKGDPG